MAKKLISGHLNEKRDMYYMILYLPDPVTGKKKPNWFATGLKIKGNLTRANKMLQKARKDATNGILPDKKSKEIAQTEQVPERTQFSSDMLYADYVLMWLSANRSNWEVVTYAAYHRAVTSVIAPYFRERTIKLNELTTLDIQEFYNFLRTKKMGGNSILHYHANVRKSLVDAVRIYKLLKYNPASDVVRPKKDNFRSSVYDAEQLQQMFVVFEGSGVELPVVLATYYGLRRSEVLGLKWSNIDFKEKTITIGHTVSRVKVDNERQLIAKNRTKNKASFRSLPLIPVVEQILKEAKKRQARNRTLCGAQYDNDYLDYICVNDVGRIIYPDTVSQAFSTRLKKCGLPHIRFHDLRHSCATLLIANGVTLKEIQLWLGHSNIATTSEIYIHFGDDKQNSANTIAQCLPKLK